MGKDWDRIKKAANRAFKDVKSTVNHVVGGGGTVAEDCWDRFQDAEIQLCDSTGTIVRELPKDFGIPKLGIDDVIGENAREVFLAHCKEKFAERQITACGESVEQTQANEQEAASSIGSSLSTCQKSINLHNELTKDGSKNAAIAYTAAVDCCTKQKVLGSACYVNYKACISAPDESSRFCAITDEECYKQAVGCSSEANADL